MLVERKGEVVHVSGDGLTILLDLALARRVGAAVEVSQLAVAETSTHVLSEDHPLWEAGAGGDRNALGKRWRDSDTALAAEAYSYFSEPARQLLRLWTKFPGRLFDTQELVQILGLKNSNVLAGHLKGFTKGCRSVDRVPPYYWWPREDQPTIFATRPSVAAVFIAAIG